MRGAAPKAIREFVGHSTLTMTLALTEAVGEGRHSAISPSKAANLAQR